MGGTRRGTEAVGVAMCPSLVLVRVFTGDAGPARIDCCRCIGGPTKRACAVWVCRMQIRLERHEILRGFREDGLLALLRGRGDVDVVCGTPFEDV